MSRFQQITATELNQLLGDPKTTQLLDVRNDDEVARGVIRGALHIPLHLLPMRRKELDDETPLAIYCHSGVRSMYACEYLAQQGYGQLFNLHGGILAWGTAGLPIVSKGSA
jgi:rhodanese-related sulfurtransferase